jgi:hypothetical protein
MLRTTDCCMVRDKPINVNHPLLPVLHAFSRKCTELPCRTVEACNVDLTVKRTVIEGKSVLNTW